MPDDMESAEAAAASGDSYAVKVFECLADLAMERAPRHGRIWLKEMWLKKEFPLPASRNKFLECNACQLLWAYDKKDWIEVTRNLDWWKWFHDKTDFTEGEDLTCEEVYRNAMALSCEVAARVAWARNNDTFTVPCQNLAAAHAGWLIAGIGVASRMSVRDHQDEARRGVALIGDGKPKFAVVGVAQAGIRGCIRKPNGDFRFTDRAALSMIVCQAIGREYNNKVRNNSKEAHEIFTGLNRRFPGSPRWGMVGARFAIVTRFVAEPNSPDAAEDLCSMLLPPALNVDVDRYWNNAVVFRLEHDRPSSTDDWMTDTLHPSGYAELGTCDDGHRATKIRQFTREETTAIAHYVEGETMPRVRTRRPEGPKAYTIQSRPGQRVTVERAVHTEPPLPAPPPGADPLPPLSKPRSKSWFNLS